MNENETKSTIVAMEIAGAESIPECNTTAQVIPQREDDES